MLCGTEDISLGNKTSIKSFIKIRSFFQSLEINVHCKACLPLHLQIIMECV